MNVKNSCVVICRESCLVLEIKKRVVSGAKEVITVFSWANTSSVKTLPRKEKQRGGKKIKYWLNQQTWNKRCHEYSRMSWGQRYILHIVVFFSCSPLFLFNCSTSKTYSLAESKSGGAWWWWWWGGIKHTICWVHAISHISLTLLCVNHRQRSSGWKTNENVMKI